MMIKVFGSWINPDHILDLIPNHWGDGKDTIARTYNLCGFADSNKLKVWENKSVDEVGNEINKQIAETKQK